MTQITSSEKYAIVNILSQIMKADGIIHPKEEEYMDKIYGELGITINDLEDAANVDDLQAKFIIDEMNAENREYARSLFIGMAKCDGYVHPNELAIINEICKYGG